jgi:hypothetical protein
VTKSCGHRTAVGKRLIAVVSLLLGLVVGAPAAHAQMCSDVCHADSACETSCLLDDKVCTVGWNAWDPDSMEIVNTLARAAATSDPVRSLLRTVAAGDASKSVRDAAGAALASRPPQEQGGPR